MASTGVGTSPHLAGELFQVMTGTKMVNVPYRGEAPAMTDLISGQIDIYFDQAVTAVPNSRAGRVKAYAVTANKRMAAAPDIPTVDEAGVPGLHISIWHALWMPKGTPKEIIIKINGAVVKTLADPVVRQKLADLSYEVGPPEEQTPEYFGAFHKAETEKWWPIIKAANIKSE